MSKPFFWKNTSLKINSETSEGASLIEALNNQDISLRVDDLTYTLENQQNYYILEDEFINNSKNLSTIIRKYSLKDYIEPSRIYDKPLKKFKDLEVDSSDKNIYEEIIAENIIDADIREFPISINVLRKVFSEGNGKSSLILDVFILIALANKSSFNAEEFKFEIRIEDKSYSKSINLKNKSIDLFLLYDWIVNDAEYKESYNVKLHIVRQVIVIKQNIDDVFDILKDSKLAYKRIISKKTNEYFEQLNQLKDDFLILSKNENSALRTLNLTFFAWLGSLGLELFKIITDYNGANILQYILFSKGAKKSIIIMIFIIALVAIFLAYIMEMKSLAETYEVIKRIYKDKILFETERDHENKFENAIKKPKVGKLQKIVFSLIVGVLLWRFFQTLP